MRSPRGGPLYLTWTDRNVENGKVSQGFTVRNLSCIGNRCTLTSFALNFCSATGNSFLPDVDTFDPELIEVNRLDNDPFAGHLTFKATFNDHTITYSLDWTAGTTAGPIVTRGSGAETLVSIDSGQVISRQLIPVTVAGSWPITDLKLDCPARVKVIPLDPPKRR